METPVCFYIFLGKENEVSLPPLESNKNTGFAEKNMVCQNRKRLIIRQKAKRDLI